MQQKQFSLGLLHISLALFLSLSICAVGYASANLLGVGNYGILFITALTVAIANIFSETNAETGRRL